PGVVLRGADAVVVAAEGLRIEVLGQLVGQLDLRVVLLILLGELLRVGAGVAGPLWTAGDGRRAGGELMQSLYDLARLIESRGVLPRTQDAIHASVRVVGHLETIRVEEPVRPVGHPQSAQLVAAAA